MDVKNHGFTGRDCHRIKFRKHKIRDKSSIWKTLLDHMQQWIVQKVEKQIKYICWKLVLVVRDTLIKKIEMRFVFHFGEKNHFEA